MQMVREKGRVVVGAGERELWEMRVPEPTRASPDRQPHCAAAQQLHRRDPWAADPGGGSVPLAPGCLQPNSAQ